MFSNSLILIMTCNEINNMVKHVNTNMFKIMTNNFGKYLSFDERNVRYHNKFKIHVPEMVLNLPDVIGHLPGHGYAMRWNNTDFTLDISDTVLRMHYSVEGSYYSLSYDYERETIFLKNRSTTEYTDIPVYPGPALDAYLCLINTIIDSHKTKYDRVYNDV